jgi:NAD(P)-dependent dehydrogenase (short-subunit alcohol dehydrogenase family)
MSAGPVLISGAASGIGLAVTRALESQGVPVIAWDLQPSEGDFDVVLVDVTDEASVRRAALELPPVLSGVVSSAGISSRGSLSETSLEEFRQVIDINVTGTLAVAQAVHSRLSGGTFVTIGSVAGSVPMARRGAYCSSKAAVIMLTKVLGSEWAADDIQVLCVSPGFVNTGMATRGAAEGVTDLSRVLDRTPSGSLVNTDDLVEVVRLAVTGHLPGMTAVEIVVDGGYSAGTTL